MKYFSQSDKRYEKIAFHNPNILLPKGRSSGGPTNQHPEHPHRSPHEDRDETRNSETDVSGRGVRHHDNAVDQLQQQESQPTTTGLTKLQPRGRKRKMPVAAPVAPPVEEDSSSDEDEDEDTVSKSVATPNGRSHALSPASSSHSVPTTDQLHRTGSPKVTFAFISNAPYIFLSQSQFLKQRYLSYH